AVVAQANRRCRRQLRPDCGAILRPLAECPPEYILLWAHGISFRQHVSQGRTAAELHESVDILEELHSAPHGTVLDYAIQPDGKWKAVTAHSPVEMQQFEDITQHFQRGVVEELAGIFAGSSSTVLQLSDLTISNARGALGMISLSPTAAELEALSKLRHCATFDHLTISPIIPPNIPDTPEKIQQGFSSSGWRSGLLHHWLNIATPEQRKVIVDIAQSYLSQQNSRMKRIFQ